MQRNREAVPEAVKQVKTDKIKAQFDICNKAVELWQNYMVGQQRQQISELQFDKFPDPQSFLGVEISIQNTSQYLF